MAVLLGATAAVAQVPGSYRLTCSDIVQNGPHLRAQCNGAGGQTNDTSLDISRCGRSDIANIYGRLVCGRIQGSFNGEPGSAPPAVRSPAAPPRPRPDRMAVRPVPVRPVPVHHAAPRPRAPRDPDLDY